MPEWLQDLRDAVSESWNGFNNLDYRSRNLLVMGIFAFVFLSVVAWKIMLPFVFIAICVVVYLRCSKTKTYTDIDAKGR